MDEADESIQDKISGFVKQNWLLIGLFAAGLIFLSVGFAQMIGADKTKVTFERGAQVAGSKTAVESTKIKVDVEGEVVSPGVYELASNTRIEDAIRAAKGLSENANRKALNLAQKITDGQKIYVPALGDTASVESSEVSVDANSQSSNGGLVSVNSGTESDLDSLPSIGPVTAQKIINLRPYSTLEDLVSKKALGQKTFEKIKDLISL